MRPLELKLKGFGPYLEEQRVDFSDVELFAITGPTGSGKSTLLEALIFALFGKAPRINTRGISLWHPAVPEAWVSLTFDLDGKVYTIERTGKKEKGSRRAETRLFEHIGGGTRHIPLETQEDANRTIKNLLGLDYDAFTKALFLPQGEFDRFLKGDPKERRKILFQLFGIDRLVRMGERARERKGELEKKKASIEGEIKALGNPTPEERERLSNALKELREKINELEGEKEQGEKHLEEERDLLKRLERRALLLQALEELEAKAPLMAQLQARLERAKEAAKALPVWEDYQKKGEALEEVLESLRQLEEEKQRLEEERERLNFDPEALEETERALKEAQNLRAQEDLLRLAGQVEDSPSPRFDPETLKAVLARLNQIQEERRPLEAWADLLERLEGLRGKLQELGKVRQALEEKVQEAKRRREELQKAYRKALAWKTQTELEELEGKLKELEEALKEKGEALDALREEKRRLGLLAYRDLLKVGEPCPLCGGVVHTLPEEHGETVSLGSTAFQDEQALEKEIRTLNLELLRGEAEKKRLRGELEDLGVEPEPGDPDSLKNQLSEVEEELKELDSRLREHLGREKELSEELSKLEGREEEVRKEGIEDPRARLRALEEEESRLRREKADLAVGLRAHLKEATGGKGVEAYVKALGERLDGLRALQKRAQEVSQEISRLESDLKALGARKEEREKALKEAEARTRDLMPYEEVRALLLSEEERRDLEGQLKDYEENRRRTEDELKALPPLPEPTPSVEEVKARVQSLEERLDILEKELVEKRQEEGRLEKDLEYLDRALSQLEEKEKKLRELEKELKVWERIALDLRQDNFPSYLLDFHQDSIILRANELLDRLTGGRYRLYSERGNYEVWDEQTGEKRPVHTLSGGETFLASLALALALSEEVSQGRLEVFFLDEGFGNLDGETLETVAEILESLPTQGRLVGIVTHVEALAERLPARLCVRKSPRGSWVEWG